MNTTLRNTIKAIDNFLFAGQLRKLNRLRWKYQYYAKPLVRKMLAQKTSKDRFTFI